MIAPNDLVMRHLAAVAVQHAPVLEWLESVYQLELKRLPRAVENPAIPQGRCQVLEEITELLRKAPEHVAAKSR